MQVMRLTAPATFSAIILFASASLSLHGKDTPIALDKCPPPVQAVVRHYSTQTTLEAVALDEKKKTGGPAVYEAKFSLRNGKRIEVHISPEGKVLQLEEKKAKN